MAKQNLYQTAQRLKLVSIIVAGLIVLVSAYFTNRLAQSLAMGGSHPPAVHHRH